MWFPVGNERKSNGHRSIFSGICDGEAARQDREDEPVCDGLTDCENVADVLDKS